MPEFEGEGGNSGIDTSVAASIAFHPPTRMTRAADTLGSAERRLVGPDPSPETLRGVSPLNHVRAGLPPTMLIHGNADTLVSPKDSFMMYDALSAAGVPVELHMFAEAPHGFDAESTPGRLCAEIMATFLDRYVAHPHKWGAVVPA